MRNYTLGPKVTDQMPVLTKLHLGLFLLFCVTSVEPIKNKKAFEGFPLGVTCKSVDISGPANNDTVQCIIETDGTVSFNKTILWSQRSDEGSVDANQSLQDKIVSVTLTWRNITKREEFRMSLIQPGDFNCSHISDVVMQTKTGREENDMDFTCSSEAKELVIKELTTEQYQQVSTTWYQGCENLTRQSSTNFVLGTGSKSENTFNIMKLKKVSFAATPGIYHCVIQYKGKELRVKSYKACVKARSGRVPSIKPGKDNYTPAPGEDVTLTCGGSFAVRYSDVYWKKLGEDDTFKELCSTYDLSEICPWTKQGPVCERSQESTHGNFTANYTIKNINESHSGTYQCEITTFGEPQHANFTIDVTPRLQIDPVAIPLAVFCGAVVIIVVLLAIYEKWKIEVKYWYMKRFKAVEKSDKLFTCLIYSSDAFTRDQNDSPLADVTNWLKESNYKYYDENNTESLNDIGNSVAENIFSVLDTCLCMTVILTDNLLLDETADIFKVFRGFQDNVERNLDVIFICTKELEKKINRNADLKNTTEVSATVKNSCVTFKSFMKRNTVIHWKPGRKTKFGKALFVAFPKVERSPSVSLRNANGRNEMIILSEAGPGQEIALLG